MKKAKKIIISALLLASSIILTRFLSIRTPLITIGFSFVSTILTAIILGPKYSIIINGLADLIGALLFPSGAYFFGFTISSLVSGAIYGLLLHRKDKFKVDKWFVVRLIISSLLVVALVNGVLNTIWVIIITKNAASIVMPVRILKQLIMLPIQVITILLISKTLENQIDGLVNDKAK